MVPLGAPSGMQTEEKKEALGELLKMARDEAPELWEENLNILLSLVLKNIGDDEVILCRFYCVNTNEIPSELSRQILPLLWLHNKPHLSDQKLFK